MDSPLFFVSSFFLYHSFFCIFIIIFLDVCLTSPFPFSPCLLPFLSLPPLTFYPVSLSSLSPSPSPSPPSPHTFFFPQMAIEDLASSLSAASDCNIPRDSLHEFAFHVLNESCTTVTNTAAKTAVQLVLGKANLVS